jgi:protein-S-isoprenylcysteine O-methyltransferase Ste14
MFIFLAVACGWCLIEGLASGADARLPVRPHGPRLLPQAIGLALLITYWISLTTAALLPAKSFDATAALGTLLMLAGIALRCFSLRTLGPYFLNEVALLPGQPLVTRGIYGVMRHPSEAGTLCLAFGGAAVLGSAAGAIAAALLLPPCVLWRTRLEDRLLLGRHREEFARYTRRVPAFVPSMRLFNRCF